MNGDGPNGPQGGQAARRRAHNPETGGSTPPPATISLQRRQTPRHYLTPREAAGCLPGKHHPYKVLRWIREGLLLEGRRVRLAALKIGGRYVVAAGDLEAFIRRCGMRGAECGMESPRILAQAHRIDERAARQSHRQARAELRAAGVL